MFSLRLANGRVPKEICVDAQDGRKLVLDPTSFTYQLAYFLGEYEPAVTNVITKMVREGDVCFDVGANIGWFTTLLQTLVGKNGSVHSFEPVPDSLKTLKQNMSLNKNSDRVVLNEIALCAEEKEIEIYSFSSLPEGHASIYKAEDQDAVAIPVRMTTTNKYLSENCLDDVNFVKLDVEGSELFMLKGAVKLLQQQRPPIWVIEMARETSRQLGYMPNDIIDFITEHADYQFYEINMATFSLSRIHRFAEESPGAYVLFVPKGPYRDRLKDLVDIV